MANTIRNTSLAFNVRNSRKPIKYNPPYSMGDLFLVWLALVVAVAAGSTGILYALRIGGLL